MLLFKKNWSIYNSTLLWQKEKKVKKVKKISEKYFSLGCNLSTKLNKFLWECD